MSTTGMKKVTCPIFDDHDYPKWKSMMKKRLMAMNSELWTVTEIGLTDLCKMAEADNILHSTQPHGEGRHLLLSVSKSVQEHHASKSCEAYLGPSL